MHIQEIREEIIYWEFVLRVDNGQAHFAINSSGKNGAGYFFPGTGDPQEFNWEK